MLCRSVISVSRTTGGKDVTRRALSFTTTRTSTILSSNCHGVKSAHLERSALSPFHDDKQLNVIPKSLLQVQQQQYRCKQSKASKKNKKKGQNNAAVEEVAEEVEEEEQHHEEEEEEEEDAQVLPDASQIKERMMTMISHFEESLKSIRGAEATPDMFDDVQVNAYNSANTPLKAVAQVVISSPTVAIVTCFDPAVAKEVKSSIQYQLSLNPQLEEAGVLKVPLPKVSMESRQQTAKQLGQKAEKFRQKLRRVRRSYNNILKKGKEGKLEHISKDDVFRVAKEIDDATEECIKKLNDITEAKRKSIVDV